MRFRFEKNGAKESFASVDSADVEIVEGARAEANTDAAATETDAESAGAAGADEGAAVPTCEFAEPVEAASGEADAPAAATAAATAATAAATADAPADAHADADAEAETSMVHVGPAEAEMELTPEERNILQRKLDRTVGNVEVSYENNRFYSVFIIVDGIEDPRAKVDRMESWRFTLEPGTHYIQTRNGRYTSPPVELTIESPEDCYLGQIHGVVRSSVTFQKVESLGKFRAFF